MREEEEVVISRLERRKGEKRRVKESKGEESGGKERKEEESGGKERKGQWRKGKEKYMKLLYNDKCFLHIESVYT